MRRLKHAQRKLVRLDQAKVLEVLESYGTFQSSALLVHSSLSACGHMIEGPATLVGALRRWITERAALAMPSHTWSYPAESDLAPLYDYQATASVVGAITDYFWRQPGVTRSLHPSHSIASDGPNAEALLRGHELCETPCGRGTPYEFLVRSDCSVLMFGATMNAYTLFHTAEDAAEVPYLYMPQQLILRSKMKDGTIKEIPTWRQDMGVTRRFGDMSTWLEEQGLLVRRKLGLGELLYVPSAGALHERLVAELRRFPMLLVAESARPEINRRFAYASKS